MTIFADTINQFNHQLQGALAKSMGALPENMQHALAKGIDAPLEFTNADSHMLLLIAGSRIINETLMSDSPAKSRAIFRKKMQIMQGKGLGSVSSRDLTITGRDNTPITLRHYTCNTVTDAKTDTKTPLVLFFHGGGFVLGSIHSHDEFCQYLCHFGHLQVLSVDYRLAPEYPIPAAIHDCEDSLKWAFTQAGELNIDANKIAVAGDSAGGNIATVICQRNKNTAFSPAAQFLIYPVTDMGKDYPSYNDYGKGLFLTIQDKFLFEQFYLQNSGIKHTNPLIAPMRGDVTNIAPAYIVTAELDLLADEGEAYAHKLKQHGVNCVTKRMLGLPHGFINMLGIHHGSRLASLAIISEFAAFLGDT